MVFSHHVHETRAAHGFHRLLVGVREDEADAVLAAVPVEVLQRVHARRIERWHASHADDQVLREGFHRYVGYAIGHAEEHGSVDLVHAHAFREFAQVRDLGILVAVVFPAANLGLLAHHLHEQDDRDQHAHGNRHHQVEHDGQREGEQQRGHRSSGGRLAQVCEIAPSRHVVGDVQQDGRDGRHGDEGCIGHEEHEDDQQHERMGHAGDGRSASVLHVRGGARDGAGCGDSAE